jgi:GAF domain-containing protein
MTALPPDVVADLRQENARLQAELRAARDRQAGSAEVLRTIGSASGDAEQSLNRIAETTKRLFEASSVSIFVAEGDKWGRIIHDGASSQRIGAEVPVAQLRIGGHSLPGATFTENRQIHLPDINNVDPAIEDWPGLRPARAAGTRTISGTPLRHAGQAIGVLIVHRDRLAPFTAEELALLQTFADQAAIAIENARLFNETQEALARQTATSEILRVISQSPTDVQPVFDAIVLTAVRLLGCDRAFFLRCDSTTYSRVAIATPEGLQADLGPGREPIDPNANFPSRAMVEKKTLHLPDWSLVDLPEHERFIHETYGVNSSLYLPLLREGECIGLLVLGGKRPGMFGESEIVLAESFRDQALIAIENTRLFNETQEALERQNASAEILRTIAAAPGDAGRSLQQIAETSARLFGAPSVSIQLVEDGKWADAYRFGDSAQRIRAAVPLSEIRVGGRNLPGAVAGENRQIHIPDLDHLDASLADFPGLPHARAAGTRTMCGTPLRREGKAIGALIIYRDQLLPFTQEELALQQSFADQAVIAIENARLFNETREALERQTATADILKVIASSPSDVQPVFEAIAASANRLIGGFSTAVHRVIDDVVHLVAFTPTNPESDEALKAAFPVRRNEMAAVTMVQNGETAQVADAETADPQTRRLGRARGWRSVTFTPLMSQGAFIGFIACTRRETGVLGDHHVQLLQTFADQAVIAIENVRLFNETQEALERQTATADILKVIASSPSDVQPVFEAIATSANRLIGGFSSTVFRFIDGVAHLKAFTPTTPAADEVLQATFPRPVADFPAFQMAQAGEVTQIPDTEALSDEILDIARARGFRSMLFTPLMNDGVSMGFIVVTRVQPGAFADHHVQLLRTFADQAVIAIENGRLFEEVQARTRDLSESLQQQTATADVLKVISRSAFDLQVVLDTLTQSAAALCNADMACISRQDGTGFVHVTNYNFPADWVDYSRSYKLQAGRGSIVGRALLDGKIVQVADVLADPEYTYHEPQQKAGYRTFLSVPLLREGHPIGVLSLCRRTVAPFTDKQIELVTTFADQAVIAIENVRLFDEVQAKTRDLTEALTYQTGSSNILKVIASSPTDVGPVLKAIVESACELCEADDAIVQLRDGDDLVFAAHRGSIPVGLQRRAITRNFVSGRANVDKVPVHLRDALSAEGGEFPEAQEMSRRLGTRTLLAAPLLREGESIGTILLRRTVVNPFSEKQIALLQTFADQAVIAIGNVRLFDEVQARTEDLRESLQVQTATSDVLKVISRSPDALQPVLDVIVHTSRELCGSDGATLFLLRDNKFHFTAVSGVVPKHLESLQTTPREIGDGSVFTRVAKQKRTLHYPNIADDPELMQSSTALGGPRALLLVPLMQNSEVIGTIVLRQSHLRPFTPRQIQAIEVFADQAVIAISNVGLFEQVQERTRELSQSLDELRTAQDRLVQTEKLASLGQLTAGIAHEIKNPLNFVNNFSALSAELTDELNDLLRSTALNDKLREEVDELTAMLKDNLQKVVQHGKRADSIVKNMLLHSREGSGEHRPADINAILDESLNLAYHGARAEKREFNVTLQRDFDEMAGTIEMFPQEITRVFLNLISNGFYAVTKRKTENGGSDFEPVVRATTRSLGDTVEIRIRDNGTGIPAEVKEKMFNPFFTTKPAGEGTGLGLSMSHDIIVKQHGGRIDVETEPGEFTEFRIVLPRTKNLSDKNRGQT